MASREFAALMSAMKSDLIAPSDSLEVARDKLNAVHGHPIGKGVDVEWTAFRGVRCAWVDTPASLGEHSVLLLCHGGGYIAAGGDGYLFYAEMLSRACRTRVLLVDYRLAPEHRHPAALEDIADAYQGLIESGVSAGNVGFVGDSCGGALAITAMLELRDRGVPLPALAVALGGWFDLEATGDSAHNPVGRDPFIHRDLIRARGRDYVGPAGELRDPRVSPLHADLRNLPPLLLQVGQVDITRDDAIRLASQAGRDGVEVTLEIHPEMIHGFQGLANAGIPEANDALRRVSDYVRLRLD